jgi:hypothetical protein
MSNTSQNSSVKKGGYNSSFFKGIKNLFHYLDSKVNVLNTSKVFAGLMIVILNISSKFVTIKLSKSMESYLKYTFSRDVLVFAICWVGSRDIYVAIILTAIFIFFVDFLLNEDSSLCILSDNFKEHHISLIEGNTTITDEQIKQAKEILEKAEKQKSQETSNAVNTTDSVSQSFMPIGSNNVANTARQSTMPTTRLPMSGGNNMPNIV